MAEVEKQRHAVERGAILQTLAQDFTSEMTSVKVLRYSLDAQNISLSMEGLAFHLAYLEASKYVKLWRAKNVPGYRFDRVSGSQKPDTIMFAKLTPEGLKLVDGVIAADPLVTF